VRPSKKALPFGKVRHAELSAISSADDEPGRPNDFLIDLALRAVGRARSVSMSNVVGRMKNSPYYPEVWPGEHYKLLAGLIADIQPQLVVEIGTSSGLSAFGMLPHLPPGGRLVTFDLIPWNEFTDTVLTESEFADGRLEQVLGDITDPTVYSRHKGLFDRAGLIFVDGPKDGLFEDRFVALLEKHAFPTPPVVVFDDIRLWKMLRTWRGIQKPKLDLTSFGHWSGTGLVQWVPA
jgi:predicted O-methyltransferase YrrM